MSSRPADMEWLVFQSLERAEDGSLIEGELRLDPEAVRGVWRERVRDGEWTVSVLVADIGRVLYAVAATQGDADNKATSLRRMIARARRHNAEGGDDE